MATAGSSSSAKPPKQGNEGGPAYIATQSTFVAIATLVVLIRIYVRTFVVKKFGLDDAAISLAMVNINFIDGYISLTANSSCLLSSAP